MRDSTNRRLAITLLATSMLALGGCGGTPTPFPTPESELGYRPGLLTGEKGAWELTVPDPYSRPQPR